MLNGVRRRVSYSNVVATIALVAALGTGGAYAAGKVTSKQIARSAVKAKHLTNNSVTAKKVKDGSLLARDFKAGQLPEGKEGPPGPAGPAGPDGHQGPVGPPGISGYQVVEGDLVTVPASGAATQALALCPAGKLALGGGYRSSGLTNQSFLAAIENRPLGNETGWQVTFINPSPGPESGRAYAVCATVTG